MNRLLKIAIGITVLIFLTLASLINASQGPARGHRPPSARQLLLHVQAPKGPIYDDADASSPVYDDACPDAKDLEARKAVAARLKIEQEKRDLQAAQALNKELNGKADKAQVARDAKLARDLQAQDKSRKVFSSHPRPFASKSSAGAQSPAVTAPKAPAGSTGRTKTPTVGTPPKKTPPVSVNAPVTCLPALQQRGPSCGYHATINTLALQILLQNGQAITSKSMQEAAKAYQPQVRPRELTAAEIIGFADKFDVHNTYIIAYDKAKNVITPSSCTTKTEYRNINDCLQALKTSPAASGYFITNTGAHWITIAIIKNGLASTPTIYYIDSMNGRPTAGSVGQLIIDKLWHDIR